MQIYIKFWLNPYTGISLIEWTDILGSNHASKHDILDQLIVFLIVVTCINITKTIDKANIYKQNPDI